LPGELREHRLRLEAVGLATGTHGSGQIGQHDAGPTAHLDDGVAGLEPGRGDEIGSELDLGGVGRSEFQDLRPLLRCGLVPALDGDERINGTRIHER
jgi:hypothetical protein